MTVLSNTRNHLTEAENEKEEAAEKALELEVCMDVNCRRYKLFMIFIILIQ